MRTSAAARVGVAAVAVAVGLGSLLVPQTTSASTGLTITVVNNNPDFADDHVFVMAQAGGTELVADPQSLSSRNSFTVASIRSGRVFVSLGEPLPPEGEPSPDTSPIRSDSATAMSSPWPLPVMKLSGPRRRYSITRVSTWVSSTIMA